MKFFVVLLLVSCAYGNKRVKRIVGGLEAAIPPPLNLDEIQLPDDEIGEGSSADNVNVPSQYSNQGLDNVVVTNEETRSSQIKGVQEPQGYISFRGIRYAEPPINRSRFVRPIIKYLNGEIDATKYGSPCVQTFSSQKVGDEDCLFLNVYTPSVKATGLPVLFWIHGGGFKSGSGNQYGASSLVSKNIVVVTVNYRLGIFGFLGTNSQVISGNSGLFDIRAAFEWTKRYISNFGGDPKKIFPAGQGHGASVATLFAQSSFTAGNVKGVIAMSGTSVSSNSIDYSPSDTFSSITSSSQCSGKNPLEIVRCLQKSNTDNILESYISIQESAIEEGGFVSALSGIFGGGPVVEGKDDERYLPHFLNDNPLDALQGQKVSKVPLFIGTTKQESGKLVSGPFVSEVSQKAADPNFLSKALPFSLLQNNKGLYANGSVNQLLENLFKNNDYLNLLSSTISGVASSISKVIEETTDALYNLPAVTLSLLWRKSGSSVYFYSFEHAATLKTPITFLDNSLYGNQQTTEKVVGHGDDLIFLFELRSLDGIQIAGSELTTPEDRKVKEIFVNAVAEFLHSGKPKILGSKQEWPEFGNDNNYVAIAPQPRVEKKFRYCQLALWGGFVDKLMDKFCNFPGINTILQQIPNINELLKNNLLGNTNLKLDLKAITGGITRLNLPTNSNGALPNIGSSLFGAGKPTTHLRVTLIGG